jgi:fimbrial isopeptide formation D2 family protein/uncharacterized repeat protein (TIGR01451 family)
MGPIFYEDLSPSPPSLPLLQGHYAGYQFTNNTPSPINGAWVQLSNFTGGDVQLAPGQASSEQLPNLAHGASADVYFYLYAPTNTASAQQHNVTLFDRRPDLAGASQLCSSSFQYTAVTNVTQATANKVNTATSFSNPPDIGAVMTMTVTGATGTIGSNNYFDMTPAAVVNGPSAWAPNAFELLSAKINIDLDGSGAVDHTDKLDWTFTDPSSANRDYTITYVFKVLGSAPAVISTTPIQDISSGTQIKHTDMSSWTTTTVQPITPPLNTTVLSKSADPTLIKTNTPTTVTYTVTATNSSTTQAVSLDDFTDTLPPDATYQPGTSTFKGAPIADPSISGQTAVWVGPWSVSANSSSGLSYKVTMDGPAGTQSNSVISHIGTTIIDTTADTTDDAPATSTVTLVPQLPTMSIKKSVNASMASPGDVLTYTVIVSNGTVAYGSGGVPNATFTDSLKGLQGDATLVAGSPKASAGTVTVGSQGLTWSGPMAAGAHVTVTYQVKVNSPDNGPHKLKNTIVSDSVGSNCSSSSPASSCSTSTPVADVTVLKQVCGSQSPTACGQGGTGPWEPSTSLPSGGTAYWEITVTNTGQVALSGVSVNDPVTPACSTAAGTFSVAPGGKVNVFCSTSNVTASMANVATATYPRVGAPAPADPMTTGPSTASVSVVASAPAPAVGPPAPPVTG